MKFLAGGLAALVSMALVVGVPSISSAAKAKKPSGPISAANLKYLLKTYKEYSARPSQLGLNEPALTNIPSGKNIAYIYGNTPAAVITAQSMQAAVAAFGHGWTYTGYELPNTSASSFQTGYTQALAQPGINAIVSSSVDPSEIAPQLTAAAAAGVKVAIVTGASNSTNTSQYAVVMGPAILSNWGRLMADYVLLRTDGKAHPLIATTTAIQALEDEASGFQAEYKLRCPKCVQPIFYNAPPQDLGTSAFGSDLVAELNANPQVNWVYVGYNDLFIGATQALDAAGIHGINIITFNQDNLSDPLLGVKNGLVMSQGFPLLEGSWLGLDTVARMMMGQSITADLNWASHGSPYNWYITKQALAKAGIANNVNLPLAANYQQGFEKLWK